MPNENLKAELERRIKSAEADGHLATAIEFLEYYLSHWSPSEYYQFLYADNLRAVGRCLEAEPLLLRLKPSTAQRRYLISLSLGRLYEGRGRFEEAEASYQAATVEAPSTTVPWIFLGNFLKVQGRLVEAQGAYEAGLSATGDLDELYLNLGKCMLAQRDLDSARRYFSAALKINGDYEEASLALNDVNEAIVARELLAHSPTNYEEG